MTVTYLSTVAFFVHLFRASAEDVKACRMLNAGEYLVHCSLPHSLGNFQGYHQCDPSVRIGRPTNLSQVAEMVSCYERVKAVGVGHSWWKEQFCSGNDENAINIVMTELKTTLDFIKNPIDPHQFGGEHPPADFPIHVDEDAREVTVAAGIPQRALLDYLSEYKYGKEPNGWTLPVFSYFIDQTIGGAVATGTHGSSLYGGSLSSRVKSLRLMLANGTIIDIGPESNVHLYRAAGVSIGRLGIITDLTFEIVPEQQVTRSSSQTNLLEFAEGMKSIQDSYNEARKTSTEVEAWKILAPLNGTQAFWHPFADKVWNITFTRVNATEDTRENDTPSFEDTVHQFSGGFSKTLQCPGIDNERIFTQEENENKVEPSATILQDPEGWGQIYIHGLEYLNSGTFESSKSYITMSEEQNVYQASQDPYEQFEVAIPLSIAGDCLLGLNSLVYENNVSSAFRAPALIRFVGEEGFYLSPSNGQSVMYINMEDHLSISSGMPNPGFDEVLVYFLTQCNARLHWGKSGWETHQPFFDGAVLFPESWCDFGCAATELDPEGKFRSESNIWVWNASRNHSTVPFSSCCSSDGFLASECVCERRFAGDAEIASSALVSPWFSWVFSCTVLYFLTVSCPF